ncbi:sensor histidine kinase [Catenulispora sp. EB89]|uniref:sensor histidine kinase n=1 Tax=Catenulispora sp. EB89 TaxID=3156257 RepID=UPI0035159EBB
MSARAAERAGRPGALGAPGVPGVPAGRTRIRDLAARDWSGADGAEYVVFLPLAFQIGVLPAAALVYVGGFGASGSVSILALCAALVVATAGLGFGALHGVPVRLVLLLDALLAVAGNLAMGAISTPSVRAVEVSWQYFAGCVALWTLVRGVAAGLGAAALGMVVRLAMVADSDAVRSRGIAVVTASFLGDVAVLLVAVLVSAGVLAVLERDAERLRTGMRRSLHDTVLQTLEAIALTLPGDADNAARRLREVRAVAHAEAVALRRELSRRTEARSTPSVVEGLVEGLVGLSTELARDGLRMRLDAAEGVDGPDGDDGLTPQRRAALLAAAREALRNVLKHSGVAEALVRVWDEPDGLTVVVRDFGAGFDPAAHQPGFGLSESIAARLAEVGGTAGVGSRVGNGTSVTLWVPVDGDEIT